MRVIYIAGPYDGPTEAETAANIRRAGAAALEVWALGAVALCPHLNAPPCATIARAVWLAGDLELLRRCDAVLLMPKWGASAGARAEQEAATALGMAVFTSCGALREWLLN